MIITSNPGNIFVKKFHTKSQIFKKDNENSNDLNKLHTLEGAFPCLEYPNQYYFQQYSDKLKCFDESIEPIQLPFTIKKDLRFEKPTIHFGGDHDFISYLTEGTFEVYTSRDLKQGKYDSHRGRKTTHVKLNFL